MDAQSGATTQSRDHADQAGQGAGLHAFATALGEVARLWRGQIDRSLKPLGLSFMQWLTLSLLARLGDGMVQKDLASAVGIESPTMVGVLDRLVAAGLDERRVAPNDRRAKTVHLTRRGHALLAKSEVELRKLREALLHGLPGPDIEAGTRVLEHIAGRARSL